MDFPVCTEDNEVTINWSCSGMSCKFTDCSLGKSCPCILRAVGSYGCQTHQSLFSGRKLLKNFSLGRHEVWREAWKRKKEN